MTTKKIRAVSNLYDAMLKGGLTTGILTLFFLFFVWGKCPQAEFLLVALPFFIVLYFTQFTIGRKAVIVAVQKWIGTNRIKALLFPTLMLVFYAAWMVLNNQNLLGGKPWLLLYVIYFPVAVYSLVNDPARKVGWIDFTVFILTLIPIGFFSIGQNSDIPISGGGFDSVSHVIIILTGVYAFAIVRGTKDVGFIPELNWKSLITALLVWAIYYLLVFVFGWSVDFVKVIGYSSGIDTLFKSILFSLIGTFLHTALFEELFFRGILQNMLEKRIAQGNSWIIFWQIGFAVLFICALYVGYQLGGKMIWFPTLVTVIMFGAAYLIEKSGQYGTGIYTSLAITGCIFGLVHATHVKSVIYIGLACIAGWAYGYTYIKTRNVFYSALVHALVGTGALIFGLKLIL